MHVERAFAAVGRLSVRFRWLVVVFWVASAMAASTYLPALSTVTQGNNSKFLPASAPSMHAADLAAPFGTANLMPVPVLVARSSGPLTADDQPALDRLQARLRAVRGVDRVVDAGRSTAGPAAGQAGQLVVFAVPPAGDAAGAVTMVAALRSAIAAAELPAGMSAHLTGSLAVQVDQVVESGSQGNRVQDLSVLFIVVLLVLIFRSLTLSLTTLAPAFVSAAIAGPLVAEAAQHGLQVSPIAQLLLIVLVLGAGTDYGLFLVFRVREELRAAEHTTDGATYPGASGTARSVLADLLRPRQSARSAVVEAVARVGESISASAGTVILAMLTLVLASFPFYADLGLPFAIAIAVMLLAALTLLPALLSVRLSLLAVKRTLFTAVFGRPKLLPWSIQGTGRAGLWGRIAGRIVRQPLPTLVAGVVLFGGLSFGVLGYTSGGFGGNTEPPAGSDSATGQALMHRYFPQSSANPTGILLKLPSPLWQDPAPVAEATRLLSSDALFTKVTGPLNPAGVALPGAQYAQLHALLGPAGALPPQPSAAIAAKVPAGAYQLYRATANYVSPDGRTVQFATDLSAGDAGGTPAMDAVPAIRRATAGIAGRVGAADWAVGGQAPALYDISSISADDLVRIIPIAILAIGILLGFVLRSLVAPLYLIASVGISYLAALGLAVLVFIKLGGSEGLVFFMPFLMFIFLLALGEDYNILIMTRIREEARRRPLREAVAEALRTTGTTITSAGLVLAGTFVVLTIAGGQGSGGSQVRDIGLGLTFGILMDTFLVRTLLVPSTVILLGRWNWWPSALGRREVQAPGTPPADPAAPAPGADGRPVEPAPAADR
ncbi:MAG TPA: MMPL family transporter [Kineosporiaceae bacterium]|nr:MMPL family transporter [Kineosporiaceae bacterium]